MSRRDEIAAEHGVSIEWLDRASEILASDKDGSFLRFVSLSTRAQRLVTACACLRHIETLFRAIMGGPWVTVRKEGDEYLYQSLLMPLLKSLQDEPGFETALEITQRILPESLPTDDADLEWEYGLQAGISKLQGVLMRLCVQEHTNPYEPGADLFFVAQDEAINLLGEITHKANQDFYRRDLSPQVDQPGSSLANPKQDEAAQARSLGRRPIALDYESTRRTWWELVDSFEESGETRKPNQIDLCERLTSEGTSIASRTLRKQIRMWRSNGSQWPPPRPTE
jgi:hypothetical protein